ncbi:uncharacterized protein LOC134273418, partial [Saccostrea cucullata]|uniref:uncharacterized protein LOC134273418 n=1 Tax=Saccostrea cuccullata TaxID=36930 RepID=UPI002ED2DFD4
IRCQKPYFGRHLNLTDYKEEYSYEEEIYFRCEGGFRLRGIVSAICGNNNRFNITEIPFCEDAAISNHFTVSSLTLGASVGGGIALMLILFGLFVCIRKKYLGKESNYEKSKINVTEQHLYTDIIHNRQTDVQDREPTYNYINEISDETVALLVCTYNKGKVAHGFDTLQQAAKTRIRVP